MYRRDLLLLILLAYLFAPSDRHLLQFPMAELGIRTDRQTCRLIEQANSGMRHNETKPNKVLYAHPCYNLKDHKTLKHQALPRHKIINNSNSFPQTRQGFFSHSCQIVHERQAVVIGETCWRCDSGIWGLEQARLNCQAEGRFTAVEQKLRDRIRPTHPTLRWFISVHRHKGPRRKWETQRLPVCCLPQVATVGPRSV